MTQVNVVVDATLRIGPKFSKCIKKIKVMLEFLEKPKKLRLQLLSRLNLISSINLII